MERSRQARVVMLTAMPSELKPLVKKAGLREVRFDGDTIYAGDLGDVKVIATYTSMGTKAATEMTERILDATEVDHVVVVGIAGGIHPDMPLGHVLVPEVVVDRYTDAEYRAHALADLVPEGRLSTSDELDNTAEDISRLLAAETHAVDMETASIAAVCERHGIPWSAFRAISDNTDDDIDEDVFGMANPDGSPNVPAVLRFLATQPWRIPEMARLGQQWQAATNAAADAAIDACRRHEFTPRTQSRKG